MEDDFYATVKFKNGEEIFAKISASEEEERTMLIVSNPIVVSEIRNKDLDVFQDNSHFHTSGLKGYYVDVTMQYYNPTEGINSAKKELFAVNSEVVLSGK